MPYDNADERLCVCGHNIHYHEDWDGDTHECNFRGCECQQFLDADESAEQVADALR